MASQAVVAKPICSARFHSETSVNRVGGVTMAARPVSAQNRAAHLGSSHAFRTAPMEAWQPAARTSAAQPMLNVVARQGGGRGRDKDDEWFETVVQVSRVTKVVKGGKKMSFRAVVVVGDKKGRVGVATGKSSEVITAVTKAVAQAKKDAIKVTLCTKSCTVAHKVTEQYSGAIVMLHPSADGTGVIAGGAVRTVLELAGFKNCFGKQMGSPNQLSNAMATIEGLKSMTTFKEMAARRGLTVEELLA